MGIFDRIKDIYENTAIKQHWGINEVTPEIRQVYQYHQWALKRKKAVRQLAQLTHQVRKVKLIFGGNSPEYAQAQVYAKAEDLTSHYDYFIKASYEGKLFREGVDFEEDIMKRKVGYYQYTFKELNAIAQELNVDFRYNEGLFPGQFLNFRKFAQKIQQLNQ